MQDYNHNEIEKKWQKFWLKNKTFKAYYPPDKGEREGVLKPKFYALDMFPYPSGAGLHVGHPLGMTATDIISRKKRMEGYNVLHPMGWDAFGLPAENYAIKTGVHPQKSTQENIANFRRQIQSLGFSYDWDREIDTTNPSYYKWSQWIFLQLYKKGLAYESDKAMNWCPKCKIVAANEEVEQGKHERCGSTVEKKKLKQWMFRITDYAERLLNDLNTPTVHIFHGWGADSKSNWFENSRDFLVKHKVNCSVLDFPNSQNPKYEDWKNYFEKNVKNIWPQDIFIGHSLGAGFIQRYLSENSAKLDQIILVAPTVNDCGIEEIKNFFSTDFDYEKIKKSANKITIIASDNDPFIKVKDVQNLAKKLGAELILLKNREHLSNHEFPELYEILDNIQKSVLDWPDKIKAMQRNWIGKSEGAEVDFEVENFAEKITVYTTRPDTLFGATYFVLSPEHPLVEKITTPEFREKVENYKKECANKSELERTELNKDKTGVFTGSYVINPVNGKKLPIWIADYVMMSYGTGAIMAVPAHDERDHEFAEKYDLPIIKVVDIEDPFQKTGGKMINSEFLNGLPVEEAKEKMIEFLEQKRIGKRKVNYKLRDWIFTRQRYWGEPIPLVFDENGKCYPLADSELPLKLPETPNYEPSEDGKSPLAKISDWVNVRGDIQKDGTVVIYKDGKTKFSRETSTMPNWAGSSWYWLRYMDPKNPAKFCDPEKEKYWGPVDLYVGGAEHAVLHLLYSRFWHKVLFDLGLVSTKEPFKKLVNQGLIMGEDGNKMSKSLGNVVNPDEIVEKYGADTFRMYEMFMGPFEQSKPWATKAVAGMRKFLDKVWRNFAEKEVRDVCPPENLVRLTHQTVKKVGEDIEEFRFNTAISQLMIWLNGFSKLDYVPKIAGGRFIRLLSPFAPHLAEEIWKMKFKPDAETISREKWPSYDENFLEEETITYAVQVNGKVRGDFQINKDASKDEVISKAKEHENVAKYLAQGEIKKEIFVPGKIIGFVVK